MEEFKEVKDYSDYLISNKGRVKTKSRKIRYTHSKTKEEHFRTSNERYLKLYLNNLTGYKFVQLYKDKKSKNFNIHRLVALMFLDKAENLNIVNHKDGNKHNNTVENLEWCTNEYNHKHATDTGLKASGDRIGTSKLNDYCVYAIRGLINLGWVDRDIAILFNISRASVYLIRNKKTWTSLTGKELKRVEE